MRCQIHNLTLNANGECIGCKHNLDPNKITGRVEPKESGTHFLINDEERFFSDAKRAKLIQIREEVINKFGFSVEKALTVKEKKYVKKKDRLKNKDLGPKKSRKKKSQ